MNSVFSWLTSHKIHLKDPIWGPYLNKIHYIIFMLQIWRLYILKTGVLGWEWIIQQATSVSDTGGSDVTLHWASLETANRSRRSRKWISSTSKHMLKLNSCLKSYCGYCIKLGSSRAMLQRFLELEAHLYEKLRSKNYHQKHIVCLPTILLK